MAGKKTYYQCTNCSYEHPKWLGRCPECGSWNTFTEEIKAAPSASGSSRKAAQPQQLADIPEEPSFRIASSITELDNVLGGGMVRGSSILVGGEPGIGKSTLMLQLLAAMRHEKVLYVAGEESAAQIKNRAKRLSVHERHVTILCETRIEHIHSVLRKLKPDAVVIDSVQTLVSEEIGLVPGTVNQVKHGCMIFADWAKQTGSAVFLVGHVTKEGSLAGPKVIEHMVDTVLYFEQGQAGVRLIRAVKNRFGSVDEVGFFTMESDGLKPVTDPGSFFLEHREGKLPAGITSAVIYEGTRAYLVEIQALTVDAKGSYPRVYSDKIEVSRVSRVMAVMEKHLGISFAGQDVYVNVAGGIRLNEVGIELPLALALYSARSGRPLSRNISAAGEITLAGEIRPTAFLDQRMKTSIAMGFDRMIGPVQAHNFRGYTGCTSIQEALQAAYGPDASGA